MRNAGLGSIKAGIKIGRSNINNFRNAEDTTLMAESKEELKSFLVTVKVSGSQCQRQLRYRIFSLSRNFYRTALF